MIVINFKNYLKGEQTIALAKQIEKYLPKAIIAVPTADIFEVTAETRLKTFAQHFDPAQKGKTTGFTTAEDIKEAGASGSLLNHSEHPLSLKQIKLTLERAEKSKLKIILCASSVEQARVFIRLKPYAIAFEDRKLIGSGKSITQYRSEEVRKFASLFKKSKVIPLCGAGINSADDVRAAKKLGCKGVLIASAIAAAPKAKAEAFLKDLSK